MVILHPFFDLISSNTVIGNLSPSYYYEGFCPQGGELLRLPRTPLVEAIALNLMQHLAKNESYSSEGKMYGVLLVELPNGEQRIIKAFSGLLNGCSVVDGWVPPIPGRDEVVLEEAHTLAQLEAIKQELINLKQLPERQQLATLSHNFEQQLKAMSDRHLNSKQQRQEKRQIFCQTLTEENLTFALEQLDEESRQQGIERRKLKRQQNEVLQPLKDLITNADGRIRELKQQRKELSRELQAQMHAAYSLTNFSGQSLSLQQLMPGGSMPTGTGDCCAPKLLHYAATHQLKPLAMAEFWWGSTTQDKVQGQFYGACAERCQPLMGFLLSGLKPNPPAPFLIHPAPLKKGGKEGGERESPSPCRGGVWGEVSLPILYEDEWLIAVNKPAGLLSVPGRYRDRQDSILSRLRHLLPDGIKLMAVHRLDQETSGILLLARDLPTYRQLSQQFQQRQIHKIYEAVLSGTVTINQGMIELPLWGDPENRPYQKVDWQKGKPSLTRFQVIATEGNYMRLEFIPLTGRTHQLRVHAADPRGLGIPILGDRLYGCYAGTRLHLHARELRFEHPQSGKTLEIRANTPF
ncbi:pseudouridine synthase [Crinalium epipsammum PCC 9333]|uniref:RNA pseudouridylate synthase n=1 Tax=Crinalium epipsammum PCC 9333 TaxID=1173022 RepID=K9VT60_9CYAN|nr:RluA family pseudouridine synthase [Crinalium epipsammum]AFZ11106.1 pseudouridine synthase [Crinalium epipsammum PCC 9333]